MRTSNNRRRPAKHHGKNPIRQSIAKERMDRWEKLPPALNPSSPHFWSIEISSAGSDQGLIWPLRCL